MMMVVVVVVMMMRYELGTSINVVSKDNDADHDETNSDKSKKKNLPTTHFVIISTHHEHGPSERKHRSHGSSQHIKVLYS